MNMWAGASQMKQLCKESDKFDRKILGKQFLLGKYFDSKGQNDGKKQRKFTKSKIEKLLRIQEKLVGNESKGYGFYLPLNTLWCAYVSDLTKNDTTEEAVGLKLLRSDFHGARIAVIHSPIDSYIGIEGIIVSQTLKTFRVVTQQDRILTLMKHQIVFSITINDRHYAVNGNNLVFRASDRVKHKFKNRKPEKMNLDCLGLMLQPDEQ